MTGREPGATSGRAGPHLWIVVGLVVAVLLVYGQVVRHGFVDYDDGVYLTANPHVQQGLTLEGLRWAFSTFRMGNWHPLTWLSHMLDYELFGANAGGHHLVSVAIHALSAVLLFLVLRGIAGAVWPAALVAALFALHPLRVESVAWAAERKDVLAGLFWILTLGAYARYARRPGSATYAAVLLSFALGLMAKPMLVTLPFVLLLLDFWPLERWRAAEDRQALTPGRLILEKLPLFALAGSISAVSVVAQRATESVGALGALPIGARLQNALESYVAYIWQSIWPVGISFYYPHPALAGSSRDPYPIGVALAAALLLAGTTVYVLRWRRERPYLVVGWLWYVGTLVPVIGIVQVGMQSRADRYTYLPAIGLYVMLAWSAASLAGRSSTWKRGVTLAGIVLLAALSAATAVQVSHWRNNRTLAEHALDVDRRNYRAHLLLGKALVGESRLEQAVQAFREAIEIKPDCTDCHVQIGTVSAALGRLDQAERWFLFALSVYPNDPAMIEVRFKLGVIYAGQGRLDEAAEQFETLLRDRPDLAQGHYNLGNVRLRQGQSERAAEHFTRALELAPDYELARRALATLP